MSVRPFVGVLGAFAWSRIPAGEIWEFEKYFGSDPCVVGIAVVQMVHYCQQHCVRVLNFGSCGGVLRFDSPSRTS